MLIARLRPPSMLLAGPLLLALGLAACGDGTTTPPPSVSVAVSPGTATVGAGDTQSFTASVSNATNSAVTWSASSGTITETGATSADWTAPVGGGTATITATSQEDATATGTAAVTVTPVEVALAPETTAFFRGQEVTYTATVTGTSTTSVTWDLTCGIGIPADNTLEYTAPTVPGTTCTVSATSTLDPSASASVSGDVRRAWLVTSGDDAADGTCSWAHCSLREAMNSANSVAGVDTILLGPDAAAPAPAPGATSFGPPSGPSGVETVMPTAELPILTEDVVIFGEGSGMTTIDLDASVASPRRGLHVQGEVALTLSGLTIRNAVSTGFGGGILMEGTGAGATLVATDVHLLDNSANDGEGGGLALIGAGTEATLDDVVIDGNRTIAGTIVRPGGGVTLTAGTSMTMTGGSISGNVSDDGWGGGIRAIDFGTLRLDGVTLDGNEALDPTEGLGGAIHGEVGGSIEIVGSTLSNNSAAVQGGAVRVVNGAALSIEGSTISDNSSETGGGVVIGSGTISLSETTFVRNTGTAGAGGLWIGLDGVLTAENVDFIDNDGGGHSGAALFNGITHDFVGGRVEGNSADFAGGFNAVVGATTVEGMLFTGNEARTGSGGGLVTQLDATLEVTRSDFVQNTSAVAGAGLWIIGGAATLDRVIVSGNTATGNGGGLTAGSPVSTTVTESTIDGNVSGGRGGGINSGTGQLIIINTTISGNQAAFGGGVATTGPVLVTNATVYGNSGTGEGGGLHAGSPAASSAEYTLRNTLLAANTDAGGAANCTIASGGGTFVSEDGNLSDDDTCAALTEAGDQADTAAGLSATLADNGGPTMTHLLLAGSAAIDAGIAANCPTTDQRGAARVGTCDVGAVEFGSSPPGG